MRPILQLSALLIIAGISILFALGNLFYEAGNLEMVAWVIALCSSFIIFGGLQCWLIPNRSDRHKRNSMEIGWHVCGLVSLLLFAFTSIFMLSLLFFSLHLNSPFRVNFQRIESHSENVHEGSLKNGLAFAIAHSDFKRDKFSVMLRVDVGSIEEDVTQLGLAHLAQHVTLDSTNTYSGRHGVLSKLEQLGASMQSFTSHRSTVYSVLDVPYSSENLHHILQVLEEMILAQKPVAAQVELEKGVMKGEERLRNSTSSLLRRVIHCHHFGTSSRLCRRFAFGKDQNIDHLNVNDVMKFYEQWYHPSRVHVAVAGDFTIHEVENGIRSVWQQARPRSSKKPSGHVIIPPPIPNSPFVIEALKGVDGLDITLMLSTAYTGRDHSANYHRKRILNRVFFGALLDQFMSRMIKFDYTRNELFSNVEFHAEVRDEYQFNQKLHSVHVKVAGHPEKGAWKRYLESFFIEIRRLAEHGPNPDLLEQLMGTAKMVLEARRAYSMFEDSDELVQLMVGNSDPSFGYLDPVQQFDIVAAFLDRGFLSAAADHVQGEAQFLWKAIVESVNGSTPFTFGVYGDLQRATASLTILTDPIPQYQISKSGSYVDKKGVTMLVNKVLDAVLVRHKDAPVIRMEDVFLQPESWAYLWNRHRAEQSQSESEENKLIHEHLREAALNGGSDGDNAMDGLPSSGALVDSERLIIHPNRIRFQPDPALVEFNKRKHGPDEAFKLYKLADTFPSAGVNRYVLANGLRVNLKPRVSGEEDYPADAPGVVELEVVSLGGRATQPAHLKGACELVDLNVPSGFSVSYYVDPASDNDDKDDVYFDSHTVDQYISHSGRPRFKCGREHFSLRKRLHSKCVNFPRVQNCDLAHHNYLKRLEAVRLAMAPVFDYNSVERGAALFERVLSRAERKTDPNEFLKWRTYWELQHPWMESLKPAEADARFRPVTPDDIRKLDPVKVTAWVKEQFAVDRLEINVVGDFDEHNLLRQLNKLLGTMPLQSSSATSEGHDIYSEDSAHYFQLSLSSTGEEVKRELPPTISNCTLAGLHAGRALVTMAVLLNADYSSVRGSQLELLTDGVLRKTVLNKLRREQGFIYSIESESFTSSLWLRFGYCQLTWSVELREGQNGQNQMRSSIKVIQDILSANDPFDQASFDEVKATLLSKLRGELQESSQWLPVLQGVSLRPPVWHHESFANTVKDISQTNVLDLEHLTLHDVNVFFKDHISRSYPVNIAIVETVLHQTNPTSILKGQPCKWNW